MDQGSVSVVPRSAAASGMTDGAEPGPRSAGLVCGSASWSATAGSVDGATPGGVVEACTGPLSQACRWCVPARPHLSSH